MRKLLLCFCLVLVSSVRVFGQTHSFSGNIGKYPIYLEFTIDGASVEGYYFYKNKLVDISLSGSHKSGLITLTSKDVYGEYAEDPEVFKFKWPGKLIEGTWTYKGKTSSLKLIPLTAKETSSPKCANPYFKKEAADLSDLKKVKIGLFKLKQDGPVTIINTIKIRPFTELLTGIHLFRIDSGMVAEKQKEANLYLEYLQLSEFLTSLECASYSAYGSDYDFSVSNISVSNDLICFSVFTAFYCGGAHPDEMNYGVNFDLSTHQKISPSDYLIEGKDSEFEERIFTYLSRENPGYFDAELPNDELQCEYNNQELWTVDCEFTFTVEGLKLLPSFPHYKAPCLDPEWAVIPYSELKTAIKPEFYSKLNKLKH
ncbi:hypothetical protein [uncultured Fluviicola sp.]|uniref:hypothetical protein n=1 Tax=uncultured Fluviicola sp. TaxID=463303 RepID=UPI0025E56F3D|nr:hypothetical protein [uncultured Fluviicola sp.]